MRSRWFHIGPGLVLAVVAGYFIWQRDTRQGSNLGRPVPPAPGELSVPTSPAVPAPELAFVLARRQDLGLNERQVKSLSRVARRWREESRPLQAASERAADALSADMGKRIERGDAAGALGAGGLQALAGDVSNYSRQLAAGRRAAWEEAARELEPQQRERAEAMWHEQMTHDSPLANMSRRSPRTDKRD